MEQYQALQDPAEISTFFDFETTCPTYSPASTPTLKNDLNGSPSSPIVLPPPLPLKRLEWIPYFTYMDYAGLGSPVSSDVALRT